MFSLFGHGVDTLTEATLENIDLQPYVEMMAYDDLSRQDTESLREFCNSETAKVLMEKQVLKKGTMVRLSKQDDEKRRIKLCAYKLARDDKSQDWKKMVYHRKEWRKYRDKIMARYGRRAEKLAKLSQKDYIKRAAKQR